MKIALSKDSATRVKADLLAVGVRSKRTKNEAVALLDKAMAGALTSAIKDEDFRGHVGDLLKVPARGRVAAGWIVLVGLGDGPETHHDARRVAIMATRAARRQRSVAVVLENDSSAESVRAAAEGLVTGAYRFDRYFTGTRKPRDRVGSGMVLVGDPKDPALLAAASAGADVGEYTNLCRDLVNAPPNELHPPALGEIAQELSRREGIECTVWNKKQIEKAGMHLLIAVNKGSAKEPRFIHLTYKPKAAGKSVPRVVFVGKGLTFDAGGLCIKPAKAMASMKCDMAGSAVTLAVVLAAARLKLPVEVHGVIAATENMTGSDAYRPDDVYPSLDGKTVEIVNTDAEGRLVLADALAYARELQPDYMIDHATLTGACMVALGPGTAGLFSNDAELTALYTEAAGATGEAFWHMPLVEELREGLKSEIADLKHTGEPHGGAITAALFLQEFVGKVRWAHCDIAGPAFPDRNFGLLPKGGTGFGVSTGVCFLERLAAEATGG